MQQQFTDLINKYNKVSIETTQELMAINARAFEKFSRKQIEFVNDCVETSMKQLTATGEITDVKDIPEYINTQTSEMQICTEKFYASGKENMEILTETTDEISAWMKKGMDMATSNLKSVPSKKAKAA